MSSTSILCHPTIKNKVVIIPFGFDLARFGYVKKPISKTNQIKIFALGRHVAYKGFDILIEALKLLPSNVTLCLGGMGPLTVKYKQQVSSLNLNKRVHFTGHIQEDDLPDMYHSSDIFCLPSVSKAEAFGIVQLEAMACGIPVVSTRLGTGVEEVNLHGITGLTVTPGDPVELAGALEKLINNSERRKMFGEAGLRRAYHDFSLESMKLKMLSLYWKTINMINET
jgi:rhamnosyl/mannosyltransferase